ncbi:4'-phosphopantetheinyl transferase [Caballeronia cordobensis]|uniref:4'-phosphopantetheinyl transferase n=1 Tax=Caballeronia cordobensis TaxID=1353886 RepID=A0A158HSD4_CABCO|nr:4'-phosphopantetheinyl transferase superfamily protein [Caballeronia cordobensis]SAL47304.1 4'-phosphopantetheinyl transferase [Caballeronia cordobensis]
MTETTSAFDIHALPLPADAPADIRVWRIALDLTAPIDGAAYASLNDHERARAARFLRHADAARFATMRCALRYLLAAETGRDAASLVLAASEKGRPYLSQPDAPDFNVSHSGAYGLIAISRARRVGVDIEEAPLSFHWRELAPAVLAESDRREIEAMPEAARSSGFFDCWTAKEAVLKAHGDGIGGGVLTLTGFSVLPRDGVRYALTRSAGAFDAVSLAAPAGYAAALAWAR